MHGHLNVKFACLLARKLSACHHCCVYSEKTPDDAQRNCPKHVEFHSKNNFEKLVHLVGFIIRIYHNARSPERQIHVSELAFSPECLDSLWGPTSLLYKRHNKLFPLR